MYQICGRNRWPNRFIPDMSHSNGPSYLTEPLDTAQPIRPKRYDGLDATCPTKPLDPNEPKKRANWFTRVERSNQTDATLIEALNYCPVTESANRPDRTGLLKPTI